MLIKWALATLHRGKKRFEELNEKTGKRKGSLHAEYQMRGFLLTGSIGYSTALIIYRV